MDRRSTPKPPAGRLRRRESDLLRISSKGTGAKENNSKKSKDSLALAKATEEALLNTSILDRERKAAQAQRLSENKSNAHSS
eukprot:jgi/Botrbrau1/16041/Bobra.7_2s0015.1